MSDVMQWAPALLAGMLLGAVFFGGLWWTAKKGLASPRPALWFVGSLLLRTAVALGGFYLVSGGRWQPLLVCLAGFMVARIIVTRLISIPIGIPLSPNSLPHAGERDAVSLRDSPIKETSHAP